VSTITKVLTGSNHAYTSGSDVAIGEIITYTVELELAPGTYSNATLTDTMEQGLSFMACSIIGIDGGVTLGNNNACAVQTVDDAGGGQPEDVRRRVTFNLGTVTNNNAYNAGFVVGYTAVVLNTSANSDGVSLDNSAVFAWDGPNSLPPQSVTVDIVEPQLQITKQADTNLIAPNDIVTFTLTIQHSLASSADAFDVLVTDEIPLEFTYVDGTLDCTTGSTNPPDQPLAIVGPAVVGVHNGVITAGWSVFEFDPTDVAVCTFDLQATNLGDDPVTNVANVAWESLEIDPGLQNANQYSTERTYDPGDPENINTYFASSNIPLSPLGGGGGGNPGCTGPTCFQFQLPVTGFEPGVITELSDVAPAVPYAENMAVTLEIPKLKVKMPIVGVPLVKGAWSVDWLTGVGGWLQGTAFPGLNGNSVITSHVVTRFGSDGPFAKLGTLSAGDRILITAFNRQYMYEVQTVSNIAPNDSSVFRHTDRSVITLMTCSKYNAVTKTYDGRLAVTTKLIQVKPLP
jgi:LPXTG-site transpeptidase (sortase) family protein